MIGQRHFGGPAAPKDRDNLRHKLQDTAAEANPALDPFAPEDEESSRGPAGLVSKRVLILNASYEPLHICSVKRAVALLMHEVAERVEDGSGVLRSPSTVFKVPSVIRLRRFVKRPPRQRIAFNRKNVFRRDDHRCQYCGVHSHDLTLDHVVPRSKGGPTSWENVTSCCRRCNARKRDRTPEEAQMQLRSKPYAPRFIFSTAYGVIPNIEPTWEKYLPK